MRKCIKLMSLALIMSSCTHFSNKKNERPTTEVIANNTNWLDVKGDTIYAHEGGVTRFGFVFYWYGTNYKNNPAGKYGIDAAKHGVVNGINVYSSSDLLNWEYEGVALAVPDSNKAYNGSSHRPHVLYNNKTKKYVMWFFHFRDKYPDILGTVAVSDSPTGPFKIVGTQKTGSPEIKNAQSFYAEQKTTGPAGCSQDLNVFQDEDGSAYLVYDDGTRNIRIDKLNDDYLSTQKQGIIVLPSGNERHESPAMAKYKDKYIVAAGCVNGWGGSPTYYSVANNPMGPYSKKKLLAPFPNLNTWNSQLTNLLYIEETDVLVAMGDQWWIPDNQDINKSRYLWLPVFFDEKTEEFQLKYKDSWKPF